MAKRVASALWSSGELAVRERKNFQRIYDLAERVIPRAQRDAPLAVEKGLEVLILRALAGHGWASTGTIASTWRLVNRRPEIEAALSRLAEKGLVEKSAVASPGARPVSGWIRSVDLQLLERLDRLRPRVDTGVLLSPFDPLLWDRPRVRLLFDFEQVLEIFKPAAQRKYGYYCLPVLAGERLVARVDLKADRRRGRLNILSLRYEDSVANSRSPAAAKRAARVALARLGDTLRLAVSPRGQRGSAC